MQYKISFFTIALANLILISGTPAAKDNSWTWARCKAQCTQNSCKKEKSLIDCATKCNIPSIKSCIDNNVKPCQRLSPQSKLQLETAMQSQLKTLEDSWMAYSSKMKRPEVFNVTKKIKEYKAEQAKLDPQIDYLKGLLRSCGPNEFTKKESVTPPGFLTPTDKPAPAHSPEATTPLRPSSSRNSLTMSQHRSAQSNKAQEHTDPEMPTDLPPTLPTDLPPKDLPPKFIKPLPQAPSKRQVQPPSENKSGGNVPTHLAELGDNPMARLKKVPEAQKNDRSGPMTKPSSDTSNPLFDAIKNRRKSIDPEGENSGEEDWPDND